MVKQSKLRVPQTEEELFNMTKNNPKTQEQAGIFQHFIILP